jgi:hypothetical protein
LAQLWQVSKELEHEMDDKTISVKVALHGQTEGQPLPTARAYLFDRADRLIHTELVRDQSVEFNVTANQAYRVSVGPDLLAEGEAPANLAAQLAKANSLSQDFLPTGPNSAELRINPNIWFCWFPTCINVHGTVVKQFSAGGTTSICNGTVQIFQVDLGCTLDSFTVIDLGLFRTRLIEKLAMPASIARESSIARFAAQGNTQFGNRTVAGALNSPRFRAPAPTRHRSHWRTQGPRSAPWTARR